MANINPVINNIEYGSGKPTVFHYADGRSAEIGTDGSLTIPLASGDPLPLDNVRVRGYRFHNGKVEAMLVASDSDGSVANESPGVQLYDSPRTRLSLGRLERGLRKSIADKGVSTSVVMSPS